ncbi:MAG: hypothetical protein EB120_06095, partial [Proteobacteria bacterium]|nr:hypothetical protein [Pseudomonadota bacterium]
RINLISLFFDQPVLYQIIHNVVSDRFPLLAPELLNQFSLNFFCRNTGKLLEKMREQVDLFKILPTDLLTKWKLINPSNIRTTFMKQTLALQKAYYAQCVAEVERLEKAISEKKADLMTKKENQKEVAAKKETLVEALNAVKNQSALELKELEDTLKRDLAPLTDEFEAVSTEKERVKQKLVDLKREIQKTQSECEGLINSQKEVTQRIDAQSRAHEKNIASLEQQISVAQDLLAKTNIPLEAQKNKLDKTKETLAQEKAKNATLFQQLSGLKNALNAAKAETAQRKSELVATEKALGPLVMLYIKEGPKAVSDPTLATCASL